MQNQPALESRGVRLLRGIFKPELPIFVIALVAAALIVFLTAVVIWSTFQKGLPSFTPLFTLANYIEVIFYPLTIEAGINTLVLGVGSIAVAVFFALPAAWFLHRTDIPFKKLFLILMFIHILLPGFLRVMGWIMLISPDIGLINQLVRTIIPLETGPFSPYNIPFMALLQGLTLTPTLFFMLAGAFVAIDPSFEESSEVCGASRFQSLCRIALPLVGPALVAGVMYTFMTAVSMFEVAALLGRSVNIHVFSTLMYDYINIDVGLPQYGVAGVYGVILLVPTLIALFYYQKMLKVSHRYATITGKGYRPKTTKLGRWAWVAGGFMLFYYLIDLFLPFLSVIWASVVPYIQMPTIAALENLSLSGYQLAISTLSQRGVFLNTLQVLVFSGGLSVIIGLAISWITLRTRFPGRYFLDSVSMLPHAVPTVAFAFSVFYVSISLGNVLPLYGSVIAIAIADCMRRVPFTTRTISTSIIQVHPELEEAVQISGGSRVNAIKSVLIPLVTPAIFYSFLWALLNAYREVTIPLFLLGSKNMVMSTAIWEMWRTGRSSAAAATGVMMVAIIGIIILIIQRAFPQLFGIRKGQ